MEYIGVYCLNAARNLFADEPEDAFALAGSDGSDRFREVEETASVILQFPRGRVATSARIGLSSRIRGALFRRISTSPNTPILRTIP
jgi:predicted dehydrogenase